MRCIKFTLTSLSPPPFSLLARARFALRRIYKILLGGFVPLWVYFCLIWRSCFSCMRPHIVTRVHHVFGVLMIRRSPCSNVGVSAVLDCPSTLLSVQSDCQFIQFVSVSGCHPSIVAVRSFWCASCTIQPWSLCVHLLQSLRLVIRLLLAASSVQVLCSGLLSVHTTS